MLILFPSLAYLVSQSALISSVIDFNQQSSPAVLSPSAVLRLFNLTESSNSISGLVPSCYVIFDSLIPMSLVFRLRLMSRIFKSVSFSLDHLCRLAILCLDQHAHTLNHLESLLTISLDNHCLDNLDILKEDLEYQSFIEVFVFKS
ncbi:hypothetical protein Tco_0005652 [Tanacetum coccineum]